jgi:nicotinate-nucleotide pyrophosphorylase (carboxylating)
MDLADLVAAALAEDLGERGDVTSLVTIPEGARARGRVVARSGGVLAGRAFGEEVLRQMGVSGTWQAADGAVLSPGESVLGVDGPARAVLAAERTLLNGMSHLSGIATLTARYVDAARPARVLDTRKTTPGWRALEKQAVAAGGGVNHRMGLHDRVLVKDNHLAGLDPAGIASLAVQMAPQARAAGAAFIEFEVDGLDQFDALLALPAGLIDMVLLDNFDPAMLREAVSRRDARAPGLLLEASGGVTLDTVASIAATGVDRISVGALTHSVRSLDLGLDALA